LKELLRRYLGARTIWAFILRDSKKVSEKGAPIPDTNSL